NYEAAAGPVEYRSTLTTGLLMMKVSAAAIPVEAALGALGFGPHQFYIPRGPMDTDLGIYLGMLHEAMIDLRRDPSGWGGKGCLPWGLAPRSPDDPAAYLVPNHNKRLNWIRQAVVGLRKAVPMKGSNADSRDYVPAHTCRSEQIKTARQLKALLEKKNDIRRF